MLDQIMQMAKQQLGGQLQQEADLSEEQVGQTMEVAQDSVQEGLKNEVLSGNISGVMSLFNGSSSPTASNPIVSTITSTFTQKLTSKLGLSPGVANTVNGIVIPFVMSKFTDKETGTASDEKSLLSQLGIDGDSAIQGFLGKKAGGLLGGLFG